MADDRHVTPIRVVSVHERDDPSGVPGFLLESFYRVEACSVLNGSIMRPAATNLVYQDQRGACRVHR